MSLIFDAFPTIDHAADFVAAVQQEFGLEGQIFTSEDEADAHDPFPCYLTPPIVHIERGVQIGAWIDAGFDMETRVAGRAPLFGGRFAGT